jgi:TnpA family transposase
LPSVHDTAYPRLKSSFSEKELNAIFTPTAEELALAHEIAPSTALRICFLILLKTFQRLGYFLPLHKVPRQVAEHLSIMYGVHYEAMEWEAYDASGSRYRHIALIREHLSVRGFNNIARQILVESVRQSAQLKEDLADLINIAIEELIHHRYELPGFSTLLDEAQRARAEVNRFIYNGVSLALGNERRRRIDDLLETDPLNKRSLWHSLKLDPGAPTLTQLRRLVARLRWLRSLNLVPPNLFSGITPVKAHHFALEARSLDAARMLELEPQKRYTLAAALVQHQLAQCLDDLAEMFIRRVRKAHRHAQETLTKAILSRQKQTDHIVGTFHRLLLAWRDGKTTKERLAAINEILGDQTEALIEQCQAHTVSSEHSHLPFLAKYFQNQRSLLLAILEEANPIATGADKSLERAISLVTKHKTRRQEWLPARLNDQALDLAWVPDKWWRLVTGKEKRGAEVSEVNRRWFELCVFTQVALDLKSGDLVIAGGDRFSDYRDQFVSDEEYRASVNQYCEYLGVSAQSEVFVAKLREWLAATAARVDVGFPENEQLRIENGEPVLSRLVRQPEPEKLRMVTQLLSEQLAPVSILDVIADTEQWLRWTRHFGPLSGHDAKLDDAKARYLTSVFTYGCNLGPNQVAQAMKNYDHRQIAWINQRHISEAGLDEAIIEVINGYNQFLLPGLWGSGERASADRTKWDLYEQNLLSEYHIRYGGYGGIGYYHISDTYIALFSHFIPCGVREAVYILDGLLKNKSDIQPDTLHADTHGQSAAVFGLAYLLGIKLMPRIRGWNHLNFYRPSRETRYEHLDALFSETVNLDLIAEHLDDLLRVAVSIKAGKLMPSTILRKLGSYSRQNRLYLAFRELGRVVRTEFLLNDISDLELRHTIQGAINKSEGFNKFAQWISFGGHGILAENNRDDQRKLIKYNHLVANCLIFYNVFAMTKALNKLKREGVHLSAEALSRLSPYLTGHVNRFGVYHLELDRHPPAIDYKLPIFSV